MTEQTEFRKRVQSNGQTIIPCPNIYKYLKEHFSPKKLPQLLTHFLSSHFPEKMECSKTPDMKNVTAVINAPSMWVMLSNMRLYDDGCIMRQNMVVDKMVRIRQKWQKAWNRKEKNKLSYQRETACTYENEVEKEQLQQSKKEQVQPSKKEKGQQKRVQLNLVEIMDINYSSYTILEYRLKDLITCVGILYQLILLRQYPEPTCAQLTNTAYKLYHISEMFFTQIEMLKLYMHKCMRVYEDYGDKILVLRGNIITNNNNRKGKTGRDEKYQLYINKNYVQAWRQKLRQINIKYTMLAKQIFMEENRLRKINKVEADQNMLVNKNKGKIAMTEQSDNNCYDTNKYSFGTNLCSFRNDYDRNSIFVNKARQNQREKEKRISIQAMTSLLLEEQLKSRKKVLNSTNSKFQPRGAINIGTKRNLTRKGLQGLKTLKSMKKQVRIENIQLKKQSKKQKKGIIQKSNQPLSQSKSKKQMKISTKKTKLQIFEQLCERADREINDNKSICSILGNNVRSWHEKNGDESEASSVHGSKDIVSKCITQMYPIFSRKILKTYKLMQGKQIFSCKQLRHYKEQKKHKQKYTLSESFQKILSQALEKKQSRKKNNGFNMGRSGRIIPIGSDGYDQLVQKFDVSKKRQQEMKQKNKERYRLGKSKFNQMLEFGMSKEKQRSEEYEDSYTEVEAKVRGVGVTISSNIEQVKRIQQEPQKTPKKSIRKTLGNLCNRKNLLSTKNLPNKNTPNSNPNFQNSRCQQTYKIPQQYKINLSQKQQLTKKFVRMYPDIECSLYKIRKNNEKLETIQNQLCHQNQNKMLELGEGEEKGKFREWSQEECVRREGVKMKWREENVQFRLSKDMLAFANQLEQKEMSWLGK